MPELVILNVPEDLLSRMRRLANKGDEEAQRWLKVELWKDYTPPFACFLCDGEVHELNATLGHRLIMAEPEMGGSQFEHGEEV